MKSNEPWPVVLSHSLLRIEYGIAWLLLSAAVVIGPHYLPESLNLGPTSAARALAQLAGGVLLAILLIGPAAPVLHRALLRLAGQAPLWKIALAGVAAQVLVALLTHPTPVSDGLTYLGLSKAMVTEHSFVDAQGYRAFWPPGLPLFLVPFVALFGAGLAAIVSANLVLYLLGVSAVSLLARQLFTARAAGLAAILFTIWPSRLLTAGVASKENLTIAAVLWALTLGVLAFRPETHRRWRLAALAGVGFGVAAMAQPGLLLFAGTVPLCCRYALARPAAAFVKLSAVILGAAVLTLAPWHARNCMVFHGAFCGLATNGGSVFYRANNPLATGGWTPEGAIPITHLPELEQNRLGFAYGKRWISEHPRQFSRLALKKVLLLLRDDVHGAYWGIFRGAGLDHDDSARQMTPARLATYRVGATLSWLFWILVTSCAARKLMTGRRQPVRQQLALLPLIYPLLYCAAVFAVFESDRRQHMIALSLLIVLAAGSLLDSAALPGANDAGGGTRRQRGTVAAHRA